jgi:CubicO group peptidase (beta-lactamase class C family)
MQVATLGVGLALAGIPSFAGAQDAPRREAPDVEAARRYLTDVVLGEGFSGVVLVAMGDRVILHEAHGFAEAEHAVAMRTDHVLRIGSLTKPVTASAALAAVEKGHLSLGTRLCDALPECPPEWRPVTLRDLLTHSSGIPDHFGELEAVPVNSTVSELRRVLRTLPPGGALAFEPGSDYAYSNFNYVLVGALLEASVGEPWARVLDRLVFEPLGLETMAYDDVWAVVPNRARGYRRDPDLGLRNIEYDDHAAYAAGGLLASAEDLFRWSRAMLGGEIFGPALVEESLTARRGDYGYGWQVRHFFDRRIFNHTGGIDGFSSHLAHYRDEAITIIVLSNIEDDSAILRACDLAARLFRLRADRKTERELTPRQRCGVD